MAKRGRALGIPRLLRAAVVVVAVFLVVAFSSAMFPTLAVDPAPPVVRPPLVGFSFSPAAIIDGRKPEEALAELLRTVQPDVVRLPVYWSSVAPSATSLDYSSIDSLIQTVEEHDVIKGARPTQVVLVVGARNLVYPEVHLPSWVDTSKTHKLQSLIQTPSYERYLMATFRRYADLAVLRAWQVENEPLDPAVSEGVTNGTLSESVVRSEVDMLRSVDLVHEVIVTTFNSAHPILDVEGASPIAWLYQHLPGSKPTGHPSQALTVGDTLGLDLYVVTETTPLEVISTSTRIAWKQESLDFWQTQAEKTGRGLWITEMQASPWIGTTGFKPTDLLESALAYRGHGVSAYLLWGVENWLDSPDWMKTGLTAVKLLRSS